jgi:hypothetical protein
MKTTIVLAIAAASIALAQTETRHFTSVTDKQIAIAVNGGMEISASAVKGAPYSATIVNESVQTLADGNRITQNSTGSVARDSQGRTRQSLLLPSIGNMSAADAPQLVMIHDPVAQAAYQLNLTDKTAHKMPMPPQLAKFSAEQHATAGGFASSGFTMQSFSTNAAGISGGAGMVIRAQKFDEPGESHTDDLGTQTMQGVSAHGTRMTRTIPAGQIGNDKPIDIVTEIWTSPDLQTIVYSKRSDPRTGEQTFQLTNIVRSEPDQSQFTVPSDFKLIDGPDGKGNVIFYRPNE